MEGLIDLTSQNISKLLVILLITFILYYLGVTLLGKVVRRAVATGMKHQHNRNWHYKDIEKRQNTLADLSKNVWRAMVITIGALVLFTELFPGISLAPLFASAGIIGVALGFGTQSLVKDFISGVFIISENQYRIGDVIEIDGATGTVERIGARSTVIRDADGNVHYFPNGIVQHVVNKTMDYSMARFKLTIHPSHDLDKIIELINNTGKQLASEERWKAKISEPPAFESIGELTPDGVTITISGKTLPSDQWSVASEMRRKLIDQFEEKGIALMGLSPAPAKIKKK